MDPLSLTEHGFSELTKSCRLYPRSPHERQLEKCDYWGLPLAIRHERSDIPLVFAPGGLSTLGPKQNDFLRCDYRKGGRRENLGPFYIGLTPVTQRQWALVTGGDPASFLEPDAPVGSVSFDDVQRFLELSERLRLPAEPEWEQAARAGTRKTYWWGHDYRSGYACCDESPTLFGRQTGPSPVANHPANNFGLFDVLGNVWEWVQTYWLDRFDGGAGVVRGGSWRELPDFVRCSERMLVDRAERRANIGFRVAMNPLELTCRRRGSGND